MSNAGDPSGRASATGQRAAAVPHVRRGPGARPRARALVHTQCKRWGTADLTARQGQRFAGARFRCRCGGFGRPQSGRRCRSFHATFMPLGTFSYQRGWRRMPQVPNDFTQQQVNALRDLAALSRRLAGELQDDWWRLLAHAEKLEREIAELERPAPAGGVVIPLRPRRTVMQQQQEPKPPAPAPKDDNPEP